MTTSDKTSWRARMDKGWKKKQVLPSPDSSELFALFDLYLIPESVCLSN